MGLIVGIIQLIVTILVSIGDFVINIFTYPATRPKKKKVLKGTFKLKKVKKRNTGPGAIGRFYKSFKKTVSGVLLFIPNLLASPFNNRKQKAKKKGRPPKVIIYKPSIFYKFKYVFIGFLFSFIFLFIPLASFIFVSELPDPSNLSINYIPKTTKIYDRNGNLLYEIFANQNRTVVSLSDIPDYLKKATIAIEDKDFYDHPGFDLRGIIRALVTNITKEGFQGGSTITQQLIKSVFLTPEPTLTRKIKEVALAFWAERIYTKDQILEMYLNLVPYGGTAWGVQSASEVYFGKDVSDLTLAESAFLAGLPRAPSLYSPFIDDSTLWKSRQKEVLNAMVRDKYITQRQANDAFSEKLVFESPDTPLKAPHFVMYVRKLLVDKYGLSEVERGGLQVITSLDLEKQDKIQKIVTDEVVADAPLNVGNGAALVTEPGSGDILAMVGSKNYFDEGSDGNVNLTTSLRQPGSSIKIVTYSLALSQGYTEATILDDTPLSIAQDNGQVYTPVNYDGAFHGRIPLRTAFANSFNIPPVRIAQALGPDTIRDFGEKLGITSWDNASNYGVSITLGGVEVKMTDMAQVYGTFANGGNRVDLNPILEVHDSNGKTIYKKDPVLLPVVDPGIAFIVSDILADKEARRIEFGLNTPLDIPGRRVSVKTGTTDNKRDNWTIGYTPNIVVATWVGNNDNTPLNQALASGITGAAPMWNKIMTGLLDEIGTPSSVLVPSDVVQKFCIGQNRYFVRGTENSINCASAPSGTVSPSPQTN